MKTPKEVKKWDLCEIYFPDKTIVNTSPRWVSTPFKNLPYTLIKFKMNILSSDKKYAKGTIFIPVPNGTSPINKLLKR